MKIGVVGAGHWGKNIVRTLSDLGHLGAVAEPADTLHANVRAIDADVPIYNDLGAMLAGTSLDAVAIATPVQTHHAIARQALEAGLHVFVEKPLTDSLASAEDLRDLAAARGVTLMVGHMLLYQPAVEWIAEAIRSGQIGKLRSIHQDRLNLGKARAHEDALWSLGVHDIAVAISLIGDPPQDIQVACDRFLQPDIADAAYVHATYPGGIRSHLHVSWLWPECRRRTTVIGDKAMLIYDELEQNVTLAQRSIDKDLNNIDEGTTIAFEGAAQPLRLEMEHFVDCIQNGTTPRSDGQNGVDVVRILQQAREAMYA